MSEKNILVERVPEIGVETQQVEIVERKGIGHPDSLADGMSEAVSRALSKAYLDAFGEVVHHNTDEVQIIGGASEPAFGGGTVVEPIYILLGGRAASHVEDNSINIHGVAKRAAQEYIADTVEHIDIDENVILDSRIGTGSSDLSGMYLRDGEAPLANDTSFGVGHAPFSETERLVLTIERDLNSAETKADKPYIGEDVKVMANRRGGRIQITVAAAFVDQYVEDLDDYFDKKAALKEHVEVLARQETDHEIEVAVNTADENEKDSIYLTVTGTSAEMGDDGSVGRGNRVSGLITPNRAMSLEASSGKNPVGHIGKIYNLMSHRIAEEIVDQQNVVDEAHVMLLSQIGTPINQPQVADIQVASQDDLSDRDRKRIQTIADEWLENSDEIMRKVIEGELTTF